VPLDLAIFCDSLRKCLTTMVDPLLAPDLR
jgi:hypothetical protein